MNNKQSFWVKKDNCPQLVEGIIKTVEGWACDEERFCTENDQYTKWFSTREELINFEIEMAEYGITFEIEMFEAELQELEEKKNYWKDMLNK